MNILEKSLSLLFLTGSLYWIFALGRVIYKLIADKIQEGKERYAYEHREVIVNTWPQMQVQNNLREQVRELTAKLDMTQDRMGESNKRNRELEAENKSLSDTFDKSAETIRAQMVEIEELRTEIKERYEQAKEVHVWVKDQASDFNHLRDVAVKMEQENERLRAKLGMASLAPSANKPAPEPHTKQNI